MTDDNLREYVDQLFGRRSQEPPAEPDLKAGNHVPREGNNPTTKPNDMQTFAAELFDRALRD